jgi:chromate reductase, NAD(P)H dehydrogenase (quinone)
MHPGGRVYFLGLSGSLRRQSNCTAVLRTLQERLAPKIDLKIFDLRAISPYDQDEDGERVPEPVRALKAAIAESDGVVLISPEYNYGMSGVLKNALDWASRPAYNSVLKHKPAAIMTASPSFVGGARAQMQLRQTLASTLSRVAVGPEVVIANAGEKIRDGRLVDEPTLRFAINLLESLHHEVKVARIMAGQTENGR